MKRPAKGWPRLRLFPLAALAGLFSLSAGAAESLPAITVYKSPTCGCCAKWVEHLKWAGFPVEDRNVADVLTARKRLGMPSQYASCHSAKVGRYAVEGHVPAEDIKRLLRDRPAAIGLAVPGMPPGSPGMESIKPMPYDTLLVDNNGRHHIFSRH